MDVPLLVAKLHDAPQQRVFLLTSQRDVQPLQVELQARSSMSFPMA